MNDLISRKAAIEAALVPPEWDGMYIQDLNGRIQEAIEALPSAEPQSVEIGERLAKIADLVEGTIDHFDRDDAMDLLYQIKGVLRGVQE